MKKIKIILLTIVLSIIAKANYAQNLVPNYSFEMFSACPTAPAQTNLATPWYDPTGASSDYFNACGIGYANVPHCSTGYQFARTGNAYAGLFALNGFDNSGREYIQVKLDSVLKQDSCYLVEFYCNLWNLYGYTIKSLGAYLSNTAVNSIGPGSVMSYTPQIVSTTFLTDTLNWIRVAGYYKAIGGEQFITIGNFKPFSNGDTLYNGVGTYPGSVYLIDDVTVKKIGGCDTTGIPQSPPIDNSSSFFVPNIFTPNNDGINDVFSITCKNIKTLDCKIYNRWGILVGEIKNINEVWDGRTTAGLQCTDGVYYYILSAEGIDGKEYEEKGFLQLVK